MREFRKTTGRNKRPQVWFVGVDSNNPEIYIVKWGQLNGVMQETKDAPGSCGVEGHADFQTSEEYVKFCISREIRKKRECGYVEYIGGEPVEEISTIIDFTKPLLKQLTFFKPKKEISDKKLAKLEKDRRAIWTLKRDGMCHIVVKRKDEIEIYSRRMDLVTERFPHIVEGIELLGLPNGTILLGEMILLNDDGTDNFVGTSRICRSDPDLSLAYQGLGKFPKNKKDKGVLGKVSYYVFDIAFYGGVDLISRLTVRSRYAALRRVFQKLDDRLALSTGLASNRSQMLRESKLRERILRKFHIGPIKIYDTTTGDDLELAKELKAEGFVVLDADAIYGDKAYSFDGKAQRPDGIFKRKPKYEDEFVIAGYYEGSGKNMGRLGGFFIKQIHPETEEWIDCGKCGGGFTNAQREEFWAESDDLIDQTIKVEFDSRQPEKDGVYALRFPVFKGLADKELEECVAQFL